MSRCSVPNCVYPKKKEKAQNLPTRSFFHIRRPEFAKTPEEKEHRQNLTNIILQLQDSSKGDQIKHALHRETAAICEKHFFKEDIVKCKHGQTLRTGAIPVYNVPKLTYQMRTRLNDQMKYLKRITDKENVEQQQSPSKQAKTDEDDTSSHDGNLVEMDDVVREASANAEENNDEDIEEKKLDDVKRVSRNGQNFPTVVEVIKEYDEEEYQEEENEKMWSLIFKFKCFCIQMYDRLLNANLTDDDINIKLVSLIAEMNQLKLSCNPKQPFESNSHEIQKNRNIFEEDENMYVGMTSKEERKNVIHVPLKTRLDTTQQKPNNEETHKPIIQIPLDKVVFTPETIATDGPEDVDKESVRLKTFTEMKKKNEIDKNEYRKFIVAHKTWGQAYKCTNCSGMFKKWYMLRQHHYKEQKGNKVKCDFCGKMISKDWLYSHVKIHTGQRDYSCAKCGAKFRQSNHLRMHQNSQLSCTYPSYECNICHERFMEAHQINEHLEQRHTDEVSEMCDSKTCMDNAQITILKLYKCEKCSKEFSFKCELRRHLKDMHRNKDTLCHMKKPDGTYRCKHCLEKFTKENDLQKHLHAHRNVKHYLCEYCCNTFTEKLMLDEHIINMHSPEIKQSEHI